MRISVSEFAENRGTDRDTVNAYIRRNPDIKEQTERDGKNVMIDTESEAYKRLDKQYPLPAPVQIIEDTESRKELIQAQKAIIQLQNKLNEQAEQIALTQSIQILLESKEEALKDKNEALKEKNEQIGKLEQRLDNQQEEIKDLRMKLDEERSKSWWDKLIGKR